MITANNSAKDSCVCETHIDCKAHNCTYNENLKCTASEIHVGGSSAQESGETCCDTFRCKC